MLQHHLIFFSHTLYIHYSLFFSQADIQYWDDTLTSEIESIQQLMEECDNMDEEDKLAQIADMEKELRKAQGTKRSLKMETRLVADVGQRRQYENRLSRLDEELTHLAADVRALKQEVQRSSLMNGAEQEEMNEEDYQKSGDDMLNKASVLQDKTQSSLDYTKSLVAESKEVGTATLTELARQREVIESINFEADRINDNLNRAEKLIKAFGKRMASDKFIQCFAVINVLLLVGVILYAVFGNGSLPGAKGGGAPASPVRMLFLRGTMTTTDDSGN